MNLDSQNDWKKITWGSIVLLIVLLLGVPNMEGLSTPAGGDKALSSTGMAWYGLLILSIIALIVSMYKIMELENSE